MLARPGAVREDHTNRRWRNKFRYDENDKEAQRARWADLDAIEIYVAADWKNFSDGSRERGSGIGGRRGVRWAGKGSAACRMGCQSRSGTENVRVLAEDGWGVAMLRGVGAQAGAAEPRRQPGTASGRASRGAERAGFESPTWRISSTSGMVRGSFYIYSCVIRHVWTGKAMIPLPMEPNLPCGTPS